MLLELIFAIVFFCLAMAASMSVFGNAYEMSSKAAAKDTAVREATSVAEVVRSAESVEEAGELLKQAGFAFSGARYEKGYGVEGHTVFVRIDSAEKLMTANIGCFDNPDASGDAIYSLTIHHRIQ